MLCAGTEWIFLGTIVCQESDFSEAIDGHGENLKFDGEPKIRMPNGTLVPLQTKDIFSSAMVQPSENGLLPRLLHLVKNWNGVMEHNKLLDVARL